MGRKTLIALLVVVVAVLGAGGYAWHTGRIGMSPEQLSGLYKQGAPIESASAAAAEPPGPTESQYVAWKTEMTEQCASADSRLRIEHFDVDGDGRKDVVCWRILKTQAYGEFIDLQARVKHADRTQTAYIIIGFDGATNQGGICGPSTAVTVGHFKWTKEDFDELGWDYIGPVSIDLEGTDCDPPMLFWPKDAKGDEVEFEFARL